MLSLALPLLPSAAGAVCYADPGRLAAAVLMISASYKCPEFKEAIFGDRAKRFLSAAGVLDQTTGSCQAEIAKNVEAYSIEVLADEAAFCARAKAALVKDDVLGAAARSVGAL